jgi:protein TonB
LKQEAMRVIRQSGKWTPAIQNGRQVKSYKKQPVVFKLEQQ